MAPRAEMPFFPDEVEIARALLGLGRVSEWPSNPSIARSSAPSPLAPVMAARCVTVGAVRAPLSTLAFSLGSIPAARVALASPRAF